MLAPHLEAERNGDHDDQVEVGEKRDSPDLFGFTAGAKGPQ